jgi:hypothetical protein
MYGSLAPLNCTAQTPLKPPFQKNGGSGEFAGFVWS